MEKDVNRKLAKLKELHDLEDEINKQIGICDKQITKGKNLIIIESRKKEKLAKRVSHNMRLRNKIINELL